MLPRGCYVLRLSSHRNIIWRVGRQNLVKGSILHFDHRGINQEGTSRGAALFTYSRQGSRPHSEHRPAWARTAKTITMWLSSVDLLVICIECSLFMSPLS